MPTYMFRCDRCADFNVFLSMAEVSPTHPCPTCADAARRVVLVPPLAGTSAGLRRGLETAEASAEAPQVVRSIPAGAPSPRSHRWSPFTGPRPINAARRSGGGHQPLPRW